MFARGREDIIEVCTVLAEQDNLQATVKESFVGAAYTGIAVFVGGILAGPVGMAAGGIITSVAVAAKARGKFKSVVEIIGEMSDDQKRRLTQSVQRAIERIRPEDCVALLTLALTTPSVKALILAELGTFLRNELQLQIR